MVVPGKSNDPFALIQNENVSAMSFTVVWDRLSGTWPRI